MDEEDFYKEACRRKLKEMQRNSIASNVYSMELVQDDQIRLNLEKIEYCLNYNQYGKLHAQMQHLSTLVFQKLLPSLPLRRLYESVPQTLSVLDIIFSRIAHSSSSDKSVWQKFQLNLLLPKLILIFANGLLPTMKGEKKCNSYFPTCRSILLAIFTLDPSLPAQLNADQNAIKNCFDQLAGHSLVECKDSSLKSLPLALQTELTASIQQKKQALQKLNEFCVKMSTAVLSESSHQRLLQISEEEVENRIFQNVSLLAIIEPILKNETTEEFVKELRRRIESDKTLLRKYKRLDKMMRTNPEKTKNEAVAVTLHKFLQGFKTALELLGEKQNQSFVGENNSKRFSDTENLSSSTAGIIQHKIGQFESPIVSDISEPFVTTAGRWPFDDGITNSGGQTSASNGVGAKQPQLNYKEEENHSIFGPTNYSFDAEPNFGGSFSKKSQETKSKGVNYFIAAGRRASRNYSRDRRRKRSTLDDLEELISPEKNIGGDDSRQSTCDSFEESVTCSSSQFDSASGSGIESMDKEFLLQELQNLRIELEHSRETICKLQAREHQLRDRLSAQVHKQFTLNNNHFEDLSLNEKRPTELIRLYGNLYSETRVEAADDLDNLAEISDYDKLKTKILFSVVVLSFRSTYESLVEMKSKVRNLLHIQMGDVNNENVDSPSISLEAEIDDYIRKTVDRHDCSANIEDVCSKLYMALFDYPCLRQSKGLRQYIEECVRVSWALNVQNPRYIISYDATHFDPQLHTRFHTSEPAMEEIIEFLWPALIEENGACVFKAVVIT